MIGMIYIMYFVIAIFFFIIILTCRFFCKRWGARYKHINL